MPGDKQTPAKMTELQSQDIQTHSHDVMDDLVSVAYHALQNAASSSRVIPYSSQPSLLRVLTQGGSGWFDYAPTGTSAPINPMYGPW